MAGLLLEQGKLLDEARDAPDDEGEAAWDDRASIE
jgi:hypothetical protein